MSKVRVLVGTKKGAFILASDGTRKKWKVSGPHFAGWEIYHMKGSSVDPNRIYASQTSGWFGQVLQRSDDGGKTWNYQQSHAINTRDMAYLKSGNLIFVGAEAVVALSKQACDGVINVNLGSPSDFSTEVALIPSPQAPQSVPFHYSYTPSPDVVVTHVVLEIAPDTTFSKDMLAGALPNPMSASPDERVALLGPLDARTTYYWRGSAQYLDGTTTAWCSTWMFTTAGSFITGVAFDDINRDGVRDPGEHGIAGRPIKISGDVEGAVLSDTNGAFSFAGLPAGQYAISGQLPASWILTLPQTNTYTVQLEMDQTASGNLFGSYFPWNSASGVVFEDRNNDGVQEEFEPSLPNRIVHVSGIIADSVVTDSLGRYSFPHLVLGGYDVHVILPPDWEQVYPQLQSPYGLYFGNYDQHYPNTNFAVRRIPARSKITP